MKTNNASSHHAGCFTTAWAATKLLPLLLLLILPGVVQAQFTYTINNATITITGYTGPGGAVAIPDTINGLPVTSIGYSAFGGCSSLRSVTIPDSVTSIGTEAFCYCTNLTSVTIPDSVTSFGDGTFYSCSRLTSVTIGTNVTSIGSQAFSCCTSLASVAIGNGVTNIGAEAFYYCTNLTSVTIPNSVTSIGESTFGGCSRLTSVTIPNSVTSIGEYAFEGCSSLTSVAIPDRVTSIGDYAFASCYNLASVTIPNSVTSIGDYAFSQSALTSVTIGNGVISIGDFAFQYCYSLTSVTIGTNVTSIGDGAFMVCTSLTSITIPSRVTSIGMQVFQSCTSLRAITVDALSSSYSGVAGVLFNKSQTTLIAYPGGIAGSYTVPNSVTSIGDVALAYCSLTSLVIPNSVTNIGHHAFWNCYSLTNVTIGNGVTSIGDSAFNSCSSLTSITIPSSVTNIDEDAFAWCYRLTSVFFQGNAPSADSYVFYSDSNVTVYYLPGTTGWGATFGGSPTVLWIQVPTIQTSPQTQTAEAGSAVSLRVEASSPLPLFYLWYFNNTNLITCSTNRELELTNLQFAQSGAYSVVVSNALGAVASSPAMLNVIAAVEHKLAAGVKLMGDAGSVLNVDYANTLSATPNWLPLDTVTLVSTSQYCFDVSEPLPPQRFYRAWQTGTPSVMPSLDLHLVPAITLTGSMGHSVRLDYINQFGPTDAWVTLATVTLTNTSQLYFDVSAPGQPPRLYRIVPSP